MVGPRPSENLASAIRQAPWEEVAGLTLTTGEAQIHLLVTETPLSASDQAQLLEDAKREAADIVVAGAGVIAVSGGPLDVFPGAGTAELTRPHDIRVRSLLPGISEFVLRESMMNVSAVDADVALSARIGLQEYAVAARRGSVIAYVLGSASTSWSHRDFLRSLAILASRPARGSIGVGILGFGAIGAEHVRGISGTEGLTVAAICDADPGRLRAAEGLADSPRMYTDAESLLNDDTVDVVIVSTPPNTHAQWALEALSRGKHVVLEKPMALSVDECDTIMATAQDAGLVVSVYQNRRFDPDFRALETAIDAGRLGDVFHLEAFVGGHQHPCNYWHSDASVSGGALFDWGSHVIDQVLQLMPGDIAFVTANNHKRHWHDVTNADHARMTMTFADGREAEFIYSDLAAALKPRWYVLGTEGAVTSEWRYESVISRSSVGTLAEDALAPADAPPIMRLVSADGSTTVLSAPAADAHPFHRDLAEFLHYGLPMRVQPHDSRRVVAMLAAAEESASLGGIPVKPE